MKSVSISGICGLLGISRQKYYRNEWSIARSRNRATIAVSMVEEVRSEMPRLGTRKLYHVLRAELQRLGLGRDRLFDILRSNHLLINPKRSYRVTTNSHHRFRKHKNLTVNMKPVRPEQLWVADITYIGNSTHQMYLSLITDAYSKKIVGYDLSTSLDTEGSIRALKMANRNRVYPKDILIHHSDRGIQYCSDAYQKALAKYNIVTSMTESYDPYANAVAERVNGILKQEFLLEELNISFELMKLVIKDSIRIYNNFRPHYSCNYYTPEYMHKQRELIIKSYKKKNHSKASLAMIDELF